MKATDAGKGINRNAGKQRASTSGVRGDATTTTPRGSQQGGRDERSASKLAGRGNELTKNPAAHGHPYK